MPLRQELYVAKLRALVASRWPSAASGPLSELSFPTGAALLGPDTLWVLDESSTGRSVGAALALASARLGTDAAVQLIAAGQTGDLARKAAKFRPPVDVWAIDGRATVPASPEPLRSCTGRAEGEWVVTWQRRIAAAGAEPVLEDGVLTAEVLGLEVARVETGSGRPVLAVGVGRHDRLAHQMVDSGEEPFGALERAVQQVRRHRVHGAPSHPANQLARERWLRAVLVASPEIVGAVRLAAVSTPALPQQLGVYSPAAALGTDADGSSMVVVASVGVDPELVVAGADAREALGAEKLVLAVPEADRKPFGNMVAERLRRPAEWRSVGGDWAAVPLRRPAGAHGPAASPAPDPLRLRR